MGLFSKKEVVKTPPSSLSGAKIHTMKDDIEHISIDQPSSSHTEANSIPKTSPLETPPSPVIPTVSPFSQPATTSPIESPEREVSQKEVPTNIEHTPKTITSDEPKPTPPAPIFQHAPLNLPSFQKPLGGTPTIKEKESPAHADTSSPEHLQEKTSSKELEALRTGAWPRVQEDQSLLPQKTAHSGTKPKKLKQSVLSSVNALPENIILREGWGWKGKFFVLLGILALVGAGGYFFWRTRQFSDITLPSVSLPDISINPSAEDIQKDSEKEWPFSTKNPNAFPIDVETESVSLLRERLMQHALTMKESGMSEPVAFSVVDKTNTPIAFFIFASIFNLGLSGDLLNSLENKFTLHLFLDAGNPRLVLSIPAKDTPEAKKYLAASEKTLAVSLKNILLAENVSVPSTASFESGMYRNIPIRYFNISSDTSLSFDYAFTEDTLIIGTSKDSARAILDAVLSSESGE